MRHIVLDGADWKTAADFYVAFLAAVQAPDWHGGNFDTLWDSITAGGVNDVNPPFIVSIHGCGVMGEEAKAMVERFRDLIGEAKSEGHPVKLVCD